MVVGNGENTDFWKDTWCGAVSLKGKFPGLFVICNEQDIKVSKLAAKRWSLSFRRWLDIPNQTKLRQLRDILMTCPLNTDKEVPKWSWEKSGTFSVKSVYKHLCKDEITQPNIKIWKAKIPLKIKVFMWLIENNAILTKDNVSKRKWQGDLRCRFCPQPESINHLSLTVPWLNTCGV